MPISYISTIFSIGNLIHMKIHTYINTHKPTYIAYLYTCIAIYIYVYINAWIYMYVGTHIHCNFFKEKYEWQLWKSTNMRLVKLIMILSHSETPCKTNKQKGTYVSKHIHTIKWKTITGHCLCYANIYAWRGAYIYINFNVKNFFSK